MTRSRVLIAVTAILVALASCVPDPVPGDLNGDRVLQDVTIEYRYQGTATSAEMVYRDEEGVNTTVDTTSLPHSVEITMIEGSLAFASIENLGSSGVVTVSIISNGTQLAAASDVEPLGFVSVVATAGADLISE